MKQLTEDESNIFLQNISYHSKEYMASLSFYVQESRVSAGLDRSVTFKENISDVS
jgi:hypothetical protein